MNCLDLGTGTDPNPKGKVTHSTVCTVLRGNNAVISSNILQYSWGEWGKEW